MSGSSLFGHIIFTIVICCCCIIPLMIIYYPSLYLVTVSDLMSIVWYKYCYSAIFLHPFAWWMFVHPINFRINRSPLYCARHCLYFACSRVVAFLKMGARLSVTFLAHPVLSQLIFKAPGSKFHCLYKLTEFSPYGFKSQTLWGFVFSVWSSWCCHLHDHSSLLLWAAPDHCFCPS